MICLILAILGWFCVFMLVGPISLDRSISVGILWKLRTFDGVMWRSFLPSDAIHNKRLIEMEKAGLLKVVTPRDAVTHIEMTERGRFVLWLYKLLSRITGCKPSC